MTIAHRIKTSITFLANGFGCISHHPILFIYPILFLTIPAIIVISRSFNIPRTHTTEHAYHLVTALDTNSLIRILLMTSFFILLTLMAASIVIHVYAILTHQSPSISKTFKKLWHHTGHLAVWGAITMLVINASLALMHLIEIQINHLELPHALVSFIRHGVDFAWEFVTFFMLQIHALEECSLLESLKRSTRLAFKLAPQVIAIKGAHALALYLSLHVGLLRFMALLSNTYPLQDNYRIITAGIIESIIIMFFLTMYVVLATQLYHYHVKEIEK